MERGRAVLLVVGVFVLCFATSSFAKELVWQDMSGGARDIKAILVDADNAQDIYFGSSNGVFKSENKGLSWRNVLAVRGSNRTVNFLLFDHKDKNYIYAATQGGLFYSSNQGKTWDRIFRGKNYLEADCTSIVVSPSGIYLGTKQGLFVSIDKGRSWYRQSLGISDSHILTICYNAREPENIYVASSDGVFKSEDGGKGWVKIFVASSSENGNDLEEKKEGLDEKENTFNIRYLIIGQNNLNHLYLATSRGVYISKDRGGSWESLSNYGLLSKDTRILFVTDKSYLYAATKSSVFGYNFGKWQELSLRLVASEINSLASDGQNNLYVACDTGLFKAQIGDSNSENVETNSISLYCKNEPRISEVHKAAIEYAEVEPEKIKIWRKKAATKALLPEVSIGIDRNTSDLWHWEGGSTTKIDDDILRRGKESMDWDVTFSWDLSGLIWNQDQTSIDVRSRLMVELRDDILDEVTKLYFERIRTKRELDDLSIEDRKKKFDKELKLDELTASIDALTGGYFSRQIKESKEGS